LLSYHSLIKTGSTKRDQEHRFGDYIELCDYYTRIKKPPGYGGFFLLLMA